MTALNNLAAFVTKLPLELQPEFMELVDEVSDERDRLQNERIATLQASTGTFEVVAIAGTRETLLNDFANDNDIVMLSETNISNTKDVRLLNEDLINEEDKYKVEWREEIENEMHYALVGKTYMHPAKYFRKVATPLSNPHQTIEGC
jgi:hypothetical protein